MEPAWTRGWTCGGWDVATKHHPRVPGAMQHLTWYSSHYPLIQCPTRSPKSTKCRPAEVIAILTPGRHHQTCCSNVMLQHSDEHTQLGTFTSGRPRRGCHIQGLVSKQRASCSVPRFQSNWCARSTLFLFI